MTCPGLPCDRNGNYLPPHTPPPPLSRLNEQPPGSWAPFESRTEFDFAHYHFVELQSSASEINKALDLWAAQVLQYGADSPWHNAKDLYDTIDAIQHGDTPWKVYKIRYTGPRPPLPPKWMSETYELCTRDSRKILQQQLANPDFKDQINYSPYRQFDAQGKRVWSNLMSGDWAWKQAVRSFGIPNLQSTYNTSRTSSRKTPRPWALHLSRSLPEVIKPLFPWPPGIKNITLFINHLGSLLVSLVALMEMASFRSLSCPFLRVSSAQVCSTSPSLTASQLPKSIANRPCTNDLSARCIMPVLRVFSSR